MKQSKSERVLGVLIVVLIGVLVAVVADTLRSKVIGVGDTAPKFSIRADNGVTLSRDHFGGRLLVLNFWATWCPPCVEETPSLNQFQKEMKEEGVVVLGISVDEDAAAYRAFLKRARVSFLTARDPEARISSRFGTFRYPETYILDTHGKVLRKIIGPARWTDRRMIDYVKSLLHRRP